MTEVHHLFREIAREELISPIRAAQFLQQSLEEIESRIRGPQVQ